MLAESTYNQTQVHKSPTEALMPSVWLSGPTLFPPNGLHFVCSCRSDQTLDFFCVIVKFLPIHLFPGMDPELVIVLG